MTYQDVIEQSRVQLGQLVQAGRPALGLLYPHTPYELILGHGLTPTLLRVDTLAPGAFEASLQTFACSLAKNLFSQRELGMLPKLVGLVFPGNTCDSLQNLGDVWRLRFPEDNVFRLTFPVASQGEASIKFLAEELRLLSDSLDSVLGQPFSMDEYQNGVQLMQRFREIAQWIYAARIVNPTVVPYSTISTLVGSFLSAPSQIILERMIEVEEHVFASLTKMKLHNHAKDIRDSLLLGEFNKIEIPDELSRPRIAVFGGMTDPYAIATILDSLPDQSDRFLIMDLLSFGFKTVFTPTPDGENLFDAMARSILKAPGEPTQEGLVSRMTYLKNLVKALSIDGVIVCEQSFCDPDEFEAPSVERAMQEIETPIVRLPIDSELSDISRLGVRIQSFLETLEMGVD